MNNEPFPPLHLEQKFTASAASLFDAWLTPTVAELWLFKNETNELNFQADLQQGGRFSIVEQDRGLTIDHWGKFLQIERGKILSFTLEVPDHFEGVSTVTIRIDESRGGTRLLFAQENIDTSKTADTWRAMFKKLGEVLQQPYVVSEKSYKDAVLEAIMVVAMQISGFIIPLKEDTINKVPFKNSWTAAQLLQHLVKSTYGLAKALDVEGITVDRNPGERIIELKQIFLDITRKLQPPEFIVPENIEYQKEELLKEFQSALKLLKTNANKGDINHLVEGLPFGPATKLELVHFVLYHMQRHLFQMRRITDALENN